MADVTRPIKRGDVRTFDDSYNKGFKNIWASEVDDEFDILYDAWNLGTINIAPGSIGPTQIQDGAVTAGKLGPDSVGIVNMQDNSVSRDEIVPQSITTDRIYPGAIDNTLMASNSVSGANIVDGSVDTTELSATVKGRLVPTFGPPEANKTLVTNGTGSAMIWAAGAASAPSGLAGGDLAGSYPNPVIGDGKMLDRHFVDNSISGMRIQPISINYLKLADGTIPNAKLAPNAAMAGQAYGNVTNGLNLGASTETTIVTFTSIVVRGGNVHLSGSWGLYVTGQISGLMTVVLNVKRDATLIHSVTHSIGVNLQHPIPVPTCIDIAPTASSYVYTITCQVTGTGFVHSRGTNAENGKLSLEEF